MTSSVDFHCARAVPHSDANGKLPVAACLALLFAMSPLAGHAEPVFANGFEAERDGGGASGDDFVNDSGVGWCTDGVSIDLPCPQPGWPGQDGERGRDALARSGNLPKIGGGVDGFDFTKIGSGGQKLDASATSWSCVQDNVTGLMWELKKNSPSDARDWEHRFYWYNPDSASNGGNPGVQGSTVPCDDTLNGARCNTYEYVRHVNQIGLCGHNEWRLPTRRELLSIVRWGAPSTRVDTAYFKPFNPGFNGNRYWTSTPLPDGSGEAWIVGFNVVGGSYHTVGPVHLVMLVRAGASP